MISIQFENNDRRSIVYCTHGGTNLFNAEKFADVLRAYSHAGVTKISATQIKSRNEEGNGTGSVYLYAKIFMRDITTQGVFAILIPAPVDSVLNEDQEVTQAVGDAIAVAYSTLAKTTFEFMHGGLVGES